MGVGKSLQVIAFLDAVYFNKLGNKFLLILPKTLALTWIQEFQKWIGMGFNFFPIYDCTSQITKLERQKRIWRCQKKPQGGLIISTYGSMQIHPELYLTQNPDSITHHKDGTMIVPDDEFKYEWDYRKLESRVTRGNWFSRLNDILNSGNRDFLTFCI